MKCFAVFVVLVAIVATVQCQFSPQKDEAGENKMRQMSAEQMRQMSAEQMRQMSAEQMRQMANEQNQKKANDNILGSSYSGSKGGVITQSFVPSPASAAVVSAGGYGTHFSAPAPSMATWSAPATQQLSSFPAPICPRNYLFSCQPNLTPAPCSQISGSPLNANVAPIPTSGTPFASAGAYSHYIPQYALPPLGLGY